MDPPEPTAAELVAAAAELLNHGSSDEAFTEAQALFRRALNLDPSLRAAEYGLEQCQRALGAADGRAAEALAKAEEGAELLNAAAELEHFDRAIEAFEEALRLDLGCDLAQYGLEQARKGREFCCRKKPQHGEADAEAEGEGGSTGAEGTSWSRWSIRGIKEGAKGAMDASPDRLRVDLGRFNLGRLERLVGPHLRAAAEPEPGPEPEPKPEPESEPEPEPEPDALPLPGVGEAQPPEGAEAGEEEVAVESLLARMGGMIDELDQEEGLDAATATASAPPSPAPDQLQSSRAPADGG